MHKHTSYLSPKKNSVDSGFPPTTYSITTILSATAKCSEKKKKRKCTIWIKKKQTRPSRNSGHLSMYRPWIFPFRQQAKTTSTKPVQVHPATPLTERKKPWPDPILLNQFSLKNPFFPSLYRSLTDSSTPSISRISEKSQSSRFSPFPGATGRFSEGGTTGVQSR